MTTDTSPTVTGGAHDTLRDDLAEAMYDAKQPITGDSAIDAIGRKFGPRFVDLADAALPVVLRYADDRVAAERIAVLRWAADTLATGPFISLDAYALLFRKAADGNEDVTRIARGQP